MNAHVESWWNPATAADVTAAQKRVSVARAGVNAGLLSKPPTGDPAALDAAVKGWNTLDSELDSYLNESPSVFWWTRDEQVSRGRVFEDQIEAWRTRFAKMGASMPNAPAAPPSQGGLFAGLGDIGTPLLVLGVGILLFSLRRS